MASNERVPAAYAHCCVSMSRTWQIAPGTASSDNKHTNQEKKGLSTSKGPAERQVAVGRWTLEGE
jgi:hypothetical protein